MVMGKPDGFWIDMKGYESKAYDSICHIYKSGEGEALPSPLTVHH